MSTRHAGRGIGADTARSERDRLLLRVSATGGRVSEVLVLRAVDVRQDALVLPNRRNPSRPVKTALLPGGGHDLPGSVRPDDSTAQFQVGKIDPFKQYGVRVPTVVVSPYIESGTVFRSPSSDVEFDHGLASLAG